MKHEEGTRCVELNIEADSVCLGAEALSLCFGRPASIPTLETNGPSSGPSERRTVVAVRHITVASPVAGLALYSEQFCGIWCSAREKRGAIPSGGQLNGASTGASKYCASRFISMVGSSENTALHPASPRREHQPR